MLMSWMSRLYGAGSGWHLLRAVCSKLVNQLCKLLSVVSCRHGLPGSLEKVVYHFLRGHSYFTSRPRTSYCCHGQDWLLRQNGVSGQLAPWTISPRRLAPSTWTISPQPTNLEINNVLSNPRAMCELLQIWRETFHSSQFRAHCFL